MKKRNRLAVIALSTLLAFPGFAAAADKAKVAEFLEVMQMEKNYAQMETMVAQMADQGFQDSAKQSNLQGDSLDRARAAHEVSKKAMLEAIAWESIQPEISALYEEQLTNAEIDAAVEYYRSPEGASLLAKQPALMQAAMQIGQRRMQEILPRMQAELKAIFSKETKAQPEG
jgi:hypothetical protein